MEKLSEHINEKSAVDAEPHLSTEKQLPSSAGTLARPRSNIDLPASPIPRYVSSKRNLTLRVTSHKHRITPLKHTLVLGSSPLSLELVKTIQIRGKNTYNLIGIVKEPGTDSDQYFPCPVLGTLEDLIRIVIEMKPDRIIVALSERRRRLPVEKLLEAAVIRGIVIESGDEVYEKLTGKLAIDTITPSSVIFSRQFQPSAFAQFFARASSFFVAVTGLIVLLPLFLLIAIVIKSDSRGPVFFVQERIGRFGKRFNMIKFRTMHEAKEKRSEWCRDNNDRITRVGKWLRRYRLDELPQFINIVRGDMNLVGPRPHPVSNHGLFILVSRNIPECGEQIPYYPLRSMVRPGITGWAQTRYQYANDLNEEMEKLRYDLYYVKHHTVWLDILILFETIKIVFTGSEQPDTVTAE